MKTADSIFQTANTYARSSFILNSNEDRSQIIPSNVMAALSLELYIKCLYYFENSKDYLKKGRQSHDFYEIFTNLKEDTQDLLIDEYKKLIKKRDMHDIKALESFLQITIKIDFISVLKTWSKIFIEFRYIHEVFENNKATPMIMYPELQLVLSSYIKSILK